MPRNAPTRKGKLRSFERESPLLPFAHHFRNEGNNLKRRAALGLLCYSACDACFFPTFSS
jgi:hypothetical protein